MTEPADIHPAPSTRRQFLRGAVGVAAAGIAVARPAAAQTEFGGWLAETDNYDGTVADRRGQSTVTVAVGTPGNDGAFAFDPPAVRVDPGTTVVWEWTGEGSFHNVHAIDGAGFQSETTDEAGFTFEHPFDDPGVVTYQCDPHATLGMKGVVVVGSMPSPTPGTGAEGGNPDWGNWFTAEAIGGAVDNYDGTTVDRRGEDEVTVAVGAEGNTGYFAFDPPAVWIDPGTTVRFEWTGRGSAHNVVSESGPAGLDSGDAVVDAGVNYEYTFEETGINRYYCDPHLALGMKGGIAVGDVPRATGDGPAPRREAPARPPPGGSVGATVMAMTAGLTGLAIVAVLAGELYGWYAGREPPPAVEADEAAEQPWVGVVRELDHDEFDPTGTAWLVALYFLVLLVMWVFMYFVEFLGNGPTVVG